MIADFETVCSLIPVITAEEHQRPQCPAAVVVGRSDTGALLASIPRYLEKRFLLINLLESFNSIFLTPIIIDRARLTTTTITISTDHLCTSFNPVALQLQANFPIDGRHESSRRSMGPRPALKRLKVIGKYLPTRHQETIYRSSTNIRHLTIDLSIVLRTCHHFCLDSVEKPH